MRIGKCFLVKVFTSGRFENLVFFTIRGFNRLAAGGLDWRRNVGFFSFNMVACVEYYIREVRILSYLSMSYREINFE